jgi:hypothetical protein
MCVYLCIYCTSALVLSSEHDNIAGDSIHLNIVYSVLISSVKHSTRIKIFHGNCYRCIVHLDNVKIPFFFTNKRTFYYLLHGAESFFFIKCIKCYNLHKISYIRSYMFRSIRTILRGLTLSLAKVTFL